MSCHKTVSTKPVAPPQWPGRTEVIKPQQVLADRPSVATPGVSRKTNSAGELKTAEFIHTRPVQVHEPYASTSDQWYSTEDLPLNRTQPEAGGYMETAATPEPVRARNEINAQFVSSKTIYSAENLQWTKIEANRATIQDELDIPAPPAPVDHSAHLDVDFDTQEQEQTVNEDPFAAVFPQDDVSETILNSDDPMNSYAPTLPGNKPTAGQSEEELQMFGIPARKLGLVALAGMILLAAILHRRRTSDIHEM